MTGIATKPCSGGRRSGMPPRTPTIRTSPSYCEGCATTGTHTSAGVARPLDGACTFSAGDTRGASTGHDTAAQCGVNTEVAWTSCRAGDRTTLGTSSESSKAPWPAVHGRAVRRDAGRGRVTTHEQPVGRREPALASQVPEAASSSHALLWSPGLSPGPAAGSPFRAAEAPGRGVCTRGPRRRGEGERARWL